MKKKAIVGAVASGIILLAVAGNTSHPNVTTKDSSQPNPVTPKTSVSAVPKSRQVCDGSKITSNCVLDKINYKTYVHHAAVPETSHTEQVTTYEKKVTGYCTLCQDDTYSPSCATGRGACSHHGGVAQWNAPRYSDEPVYSTKTVIDSPAKAEYYEKVTD